MKCHVHVTMCLLSLLVGSLVFLSGASVRAQDKLEPFIGYELESVAYPGWVVDIVDLSDGAKLRLSQRNGKQTQKWYLMSPSKGWKYKGQTQRNAYRLCNKASGRFVHCPAPPNVRTNQQLEQRDEDLGVDAQVFSAIKEKDGYFFLKSFQYADAPKGGVVYAGGFAPDPKKETILRVVAHSFVTKAGKFRFVRERSTNDRRGGYVWLQNPLFSEVTVYRVNSQGKEETPVTLKKGKGEFAKTGRDDVWVCRKAGVPIGSFMPTQTFQHYICGYQARSGVPPSGGAKRVSLTLTNMTNESVDVFWVTSYHGLIPHGSIKPGAKQQYVTYSHNQWIYRFPSWGFNVGGGIFCNADRDQTLTIKK